jgi:hypothetical protein
MPMALDFFTFFLLFFAFFLLLGFCVRVFVSSPRVQAAEVGCCCCHSNQGRKYHPYHPKVFAAILPLVFGPSLTL